MEKVKPAKKPKLPKISESTKVSCVAGWELAEVLAPYFEEMEKDDGWNLTVWGRGFGFDAEQLRRIRSGCTSRPTQGLDIVDRICQAILGPQLLHELTVIPGPYDHDAMKMACEEFFAIHGDDAEPCIEALCIRAEELRQLRETMLLGPISKVA